MGALRMHCYGAHETRQSNESITQTLYGTNYTCFTAASAQLTPATVPASDLVLWTDHSHQIENDSRKLKTFATNIDGDVATRTG